MRIEISEKNCKASEKLVGVVEKKVSRLDKYFDDDSVCSVYLKQEGRFSKTEVTIYYKGNMIRAEVSGDNFYDNIDAVLPKIEKQIYKHKSKLESRLKKDAFVEKQLFFREEELPEAHVVKTKTFQLTPMTAEEAAEQLDLLGHTFYIFQDADTGEVRVVYLRQNGDIGLLIPKKAQVFCDCTLKQRRPAEENLGGPLFYFVQYLFWSSLRICTRRILPLMVLGSSFTNSTTRGYL